jgi:catechol 2,3-dioxygenase-like lactoylglutathione lyase family enzyme
VVPPIRGIHHLKFPVASLERAEEFYTRALGARRLAELDHRSPAGTLYAVILEVPGLGTVLELRHNETQAAAQQGFDLVRAPGPTGYPAFAAVGGVCGLAGRSRGP